jgi:hypothetical protein
MMWSGSDRKHLSSLARTSGVTSVVNSGDSSAGFIVGFDIFDLGWIRRSVDDYGMGATVIAKREPQISGVNA